MDWNHRSTETELLDEEGIPKEALWRNLYELDVINKYLGGHDNTMYAIKTILKSDPRKAWKIVDLGCGGGDTLRAIAHWAEKKGYSVELTGVDLLEQAIAYAQQHNPHEKIRYVQGDFADQTEGSYDIAISSLFCHHLYDADLENLVRTKRRLARYVVINDLHRHFLAYHSIRLLTRLFSKSYLVKNDAAVSVQRGFRRSDLQDLLSTFEWKQARLTWRWAFRWIVIAEH